MNVLFIGLGRIGLPQSLVFAEAGHQVYGFDADSSVICQLNSGIPSFEEPGLLELLTKHLNHGFKPCSHWHKLLPELDAVVFTIGASIKSATDYLRDNVEDLIEVKQLIHEIFSCPDQPPKPLLLVFRTTLLIGSMDRIKEYIHVNFNLDEGIDYLLAYVPERLSEGNAVYEEQHLPKIISGYSQASRQRASDMFTVVGGKQFMVSSTRTAEFCKLVDNSYRNTIFGFANELAMWASSCNVDVIEVINTVNADYPRTNVPLPGFVSGYCLSKDPYIFDYGFPSKNAIRDVMSLWHLGRRVNDWLINYTVERVVSSCRSKGKELASLRVAILGLAFKADTDDFRMSHGFDLIDRLASEGVDNIVVYDPYLGKNRYTTIPEYYRRQGYAWVSSLEPQHFSAVDAVILATPHAILKQQNPASLAVLLAKANSPVYIFDAWNIWRVLAEDGLSSSSPLLIYEGLGMAASQIGEVVS